MPVVFFVVSLLITYFVIRKAVHHGVLDADATLARRERRRQLEAQMRNEPHRDAPAS